MLKSIKIIHLLELPNILTITRILLSPFFLLITFYPKNTTVISFVLIVFVVGAFTDYFDGAIARKNNTITIVGSILDPIADKLMVMFAFYSFAVLGIIPYWAVWIVFILEILFTLYRLFIFTKGRLIPTSRFGKLKSFIQMILIITILLWLMLKAS